MARAPQMTGEPSIDGWILQDLTSYRKMRVRHGAQTIDKNDNDDTTYNSKNEFVKY